MKKVLAFITITRPLNILQSTIAVLITAAFFNIYPSLSQIIYTILTVGLCLGAGNVINDYFDLKTDKSNKPHKPLPSSLISPKEALLYSTILFSIGILTFLKIKTHATTLILVVNIAILILYTPILKPIPLTGNLAVSYLLGSVFLFSSDIFGNISIGYIPFFLALTFNLARELIKDMEDEVGDKIYCINTFPVKYGMKFSKIIAYILILIINIGCFIPYYLGIYGKFYLIGVIISIETPLIFVLYLLLVSKESKDFARISNIMKTLVFFGLLSIYFGKFI